jgi:hypothetical protein
MSAVPRRPTFPIARVSSLHDFCAFARSSAAVDAVRDENGSKHDDDHINWPKNFAAIAAQIRECHGLTPRSRKYALPEISTLHRFASV